MLNLANKITLARILMTPIVVFLLSIEGPVTCILATVAFALASLTDWADGYVARRDNLVTSMGKFLDPLADKVLICSVLLMFVDLKWVPAWVAIIMICRELVVTGLRAMAIDEGIVLAADKFGTDLILIPDGDDKFTVSVRLVAGAAFYGWLFQFGEKAEVMSPENIRREYARMIENVRKKYITEE